jgi:hypothetical protein
MRLVGDDSPPPEISDDDMRRRIAGTRAYTVVILHTGPKRDDPVADPIIWEHGRRNFRLREDGLLPIVCPIRDGSEVAGVGVLDAGLDEARAIMEGDPAV